LVAPVVEILVRRPRLACPRWVIKVNRTLARDHWGDFYTKRFRGRSLALGLKDYRLN
jgi:hypothetical protein